MGTKTNIDIAQHNNNVATYGWLIIPYIQMAQIENARRQRQRASRIVL